MAIQEGWTPPGGVKGRLSSVVTRVSSKEIMARNDAEGYGVAKKWVGETVYPDPAQMEELTQLASRPTETTVNTADSIPAPVEELEVDYNGPLPEGDVDCMPGYLYDPLTHHCR